MEMLQDLRRKKRLRRCPPPLLCELMLADLLSCQRRGFYARYCVDFIHLFRPMINES